MNNIQINNYTEYVYDLIRNKDYQNKVENLNLNLFGEEKQDGSISYGALEKANKGTLLIDQISEIPLDIQSKIFPHKYMGI